jgi:hypothetical protein
LTPKIQGYRTSKGSCQTIEQPSNHYFINTLRHCAVVISRSVKPRIITANA